MPTVEEICAQIEACTGAPTDTNFKKYVLQLMCALIEGGALGGGGSDDTEITLLCDDLGSGDPVAFYRIITRDSEGVITVANYEIDGVTTYVPSGTVGLCETEIQFPEFPEWPTFESFPTNWDAEVLVLCDDQGGGTVVKFVRIIVMDKEGAITYSDHEVIGLAAYTVLGTVVACDQSTTEVYAGDICYDDSGTIKPAIRIAEVASGLFSGNYRFMDAVDGTVVDVGDIVECPIPGGMYDVFPKLDKWAPDTCIAATEFLDVDSITEKIAEPCLPASWRVDFTVDGVKLFDDELISMSATDMQSVNNEVSGTPEPLAGACQFFVDRLNELTSPYLQWGVTTDGGGNWFVELSYNTNQDSTFVITRLHDCTNDPAGESYTFTVASGVGVWSDDDSDRDFQADAWDGNSCQ